MFIKNWTTRQFVGQNELNCLNEGVTMEYRSKRRGFQYYVQGQIKELSKNFANEIKKLEIEMKKQEVKTSDVNI